MVLVFKKTMIDLQDFCLLYTSLNTTQLIATCPACGLLCDDALIENRLNTLTVKAKGCAKSVAFFEQAQSQSEVSAKIAGKPATLQAARCV